MDRRLHLRGVRVARRKRIAAVSRTSSDQHQRSRAKRTTAARQIQRVTRRLNGFLVRRTSTVIRTARQQKTGKVFHRTHCAGGPQGEWTRTRELRGELIAGVRRRHRVQRRAIVVSCASRISTHLLKLCGEDQQLGVSRMLVEPETQPGLGILEIICCKRRTHRRAIVRGRGSLQILRLPDQHGLPALTCGRISGGQRLDHIRIIREGLRRRIENVHRLAAIARG